MNLASLLKDQGKLNEAEPLYRELLARRREQLGDSHPDTLTAMTVLASVLQKQRNLIEANSLCREALDRRKQNPGEFHVAALDAMTMLASILKEQGNRDGAKSLYREALRLGQQLSDNHPAILEAEVGLASLLSMKTIQT